MLTRDVNLGMSLGEIMMMGEDPSLYSSLTSNTISTTTEQVTKVHELLGELAAITGSDSESEAQKADIITQITTICDQEKTSLEASVETDLTAQETLKVANDVNDTIATASPFNTPSKLFDLVATDTLRKIADKISEIRARDED
jgi:hypothetical protein